MKIITLKKKKIMKMVVITVFSFIVLGLSTSFAMQHYYKTDFSTGIVNATVLNVRSGPSSNFKVITTVKKNEYVRVFAGIGDWYVIQTNNYYIGVVSKKYIKAIYSGSSNNTGSTTTGGSNSTTTSNTTLTSD